MKVKAIIEIPEGSFDKIEIKDGVASVDRKLDRSCPVNYGFVPGTLAEDGDALDIFVLAKNPLKTYDEVEVNVVGIFKCEDQGVQDDKIFGTLVGEKLQDIAIFKNMIHIGEYLMNYKNGFKVLGYSQQFDKNLLEKYKV